MFVTTLCSFNTHHPFRTLQYYITGNIMMHTCTWLLPSFFIRKSEPVLKQVKIINSGLRMEVWVPIPLLTPCYEVNAHYAMFVTTSCSFNTHHPFRTLQILRRAGNFYDAYMKLLIIIHQRLVSQYYQIIMRENITDDRYFLSLIYNHFFLRNINPKACM